MMSVSSLILVAVLVTGFVAGLWGLIRQQKGREQQWNEERTALQNQAQQLAQSVAHMQTELAIAKTDAEHKQVQLADHQARLQQEQQHTTVLRQQLQDTQGKVHQLQATLEERQGLAEKLTQKEQQVDALQAEIGQLKTRLNQEQVERQKDQENLQEKLQLLQSNKEQLSQEFENLSNKIFEEKKKQFQQTSQDGLTALLNPFKEQIEGLRKKVDDAYVSESKDRAALQAQIGELHKLNKQITEEASALTRALRGEKKLQGNWGELVLETVLEKSGLRVGEEYVREQSITTETGERYRPDVIINLPEGKHIVVDAKVSLNAYTDYVNADGEAEREQALKTHVEAVRLHIKRLAEKSYAKLPGINSPDFVFLFMPMEPAFMAAFQYDEKLFNDAFEQRIVVVTPTTLLASLRTVANLWSIERQNKHAKQLAEQAGKIHDKLVAFVEDMEKIGSQLNTVQGTYDKAWNKLKEGRGNLISQAHKFKDLGVRTKKELPKQIMETAELEFAEEDV